MYREEEEGDAEQDLLLEKDIAAQRLWQAFQESATAVAHLFRGTHNMYTIYIIHVVWSSGFQLDSLLDQFGQLVAIVLL